MWTPDLSVCIAVYRRHRPPNLRTLSASLEAAAPGLTTELIVALNGISAKDAELPPWAKHVQFAQNRGVPVAWNSAARLARAPILVIANDDLDLEAGSLATLWTALQSCSDAGVVGPSGTRWDLSTAQHLRYVDTSNLAPGVMLPCEVVSGFLFMTPRDVYEQVGGFDERLTPCSFEEVDYCTAVRCRVGLRCYAVAGVKVAHRFGISARRPWRRVRYQDRSERIGEVAERNRAYFLRKWGGATRQEPA
jgi:GT2 family glycosyltransferase